MACQPVWPQTLTITVEIRASQVSASQGTGAIPIKLSSEFHDPRAERRQDECPDEAEHGDTGDGREEEHCTDEVAGEEFLVQHHRERDGQQRHDDGRADGVKERVAQRGHHRAVGEGPHIVTQADEMHHPRIAVEIGEAVPERLAKRDDEKQQKDQRNGKQEKLVGSGRQPSLAPHPEGL